MSHKKARAARRAAAAVAPIAPARSPRRRKVIALVIGSLLLASGALAHWRSFSSPTALAPSAATTSSATPASLTKEYIYAGGRLVATEEPSGATSTTENVVWTNIVGSTPSGNSLARTAGHSGTAGAVSTRAISSGSGYIEFTASETNTDRFVGLSNGDANQSHGDIDFAVYLTTASTVLIYEAGLYRTTTGYYAANDRFRVAVENGVVKYYKNGTLIYTSAAAPAYPLLVDTSLGSPGSTATNVVISGLLQDSFTHVDVAWLNVVGAVANGNNLARQSGYSWDAGAVSSMALASGNGYMEFTASETNTDRMIGLSHSDTNQHYSDIDFAVYVTSASTVLIYEAGTYRTTTGYYAAGDRFRVAVEGGVVKYFQNGSLIYTSGVTPTYPLLVDTTLGTAGSTVSNVVLSGVLQSSSPPPTGVLEDVVWTNAVGVTVSGNSLTRVSNYGWDAGASSTRAIISGNGYMEFTASETTTDRMAGLSNGDTNQHYSDIDFAFYLTSAGTLLVYEGGTYRTTTGYYAIGDRLRVAVEGGVVKYYKNGALLYTSASAPTYPLLVDTTLGTAGSTVSNAVIQGNLAP